MEGKRSATKRTMLSIIVFAVCLSVVLGAWRVLKVYAADPTGCTWPSSSDNFEAISPGYRITSTWLNKILCAINALEDQVDGVATEVRTGCTATTVSPGERKLIGVPLVGDPLVGTEPVFASVKDSTTPARLEVDGIQELTVNQAKVWVFNHDPDSNRSGTVCAMVKQ